MGTVDGGMIAWDVYREIHKAMRFALFGVTTMAGHTDAADDAAVARLVGEWLDVKMVLEGHHAHEDDFCDHLVAAHASHLRDDLEAAHRVSDEHLERLDAAANELATAPASERWPLLRRFHLDLADFTAMYLGHLRFVRSVRGGIGDHDGTDGVRVRHQRTVKIIHIDGTIISGFHDDDLKSRHHR